MKGITLNFDEREILTRLMKAQENAVSFCPNDFSMSRERFINALNGLYDKGMIDTPALPRSGSYRAVITTFDNIIRQTPPVWS